VGQLAGDERKPPGALGRRQRAAPGQHQRDRGADDDGGDGEDPEALAHGSIF
jgi:hypothetical protein